MRRYGLDLLAGAKYPKVAAQSLPKGWALGLFDNTFGDSMPAAKRAIKQGCEHIRVHLLWSDSHTFGDKDLPTINKLAKRWEKLAKQNPEVVIELSPFCEHNISKPDKYLDAVQAVAPSCVPVNTPWKGGFSKKYKNEIHGSTHKKPSGPYNFAFDGQNAVDSDVEAIKKKFGDAEAFFFWHPRFNLKWSMKDTTPRPKRTAKPSKKFVNSISYLATDKGATSIPKSWLIKSHAEKHDAKDLKGDKLLIISPIKANAITLKRGGKVIATLKYFGTFDGGGFRYYSTKMGFEIGVVEVWIGSKKYGVINAGFRSAPYR